MFGNLDFYDRSEVKITTSEVRLKPAGRIITVDPLVGRYMGGERECGSRRTVDFAPCR